mgnify:CR=1 FL=1
MTPQAKLGWVRMLFVIGLVFNAVACASPKPWERGIFAKPQMTQTVEDPNARFRTHVHRSREGSTPRERSGGAGCGCY